MTKTLARIFLLSFTLAASATAEPPRWTRATPFGSPIVALAQAPSSPQTLYAVARFGRIFASADGGATWQPRTPAPEPDEMIVDLVPDPFDPRTVYARTTFSSILRSHDGGRAWTRVGTDLPFVAALAADAGQAGLFWAGTREGIYRSADGGDTWQATALPGLHVASLAFDPHNPATFFAAEATGDFIGDPVAVWRSLDRGATWEATPLVAVPGGFNFGTAHFVFDPAHPGTAYAFFVGDFNLGPVFRTGDRGASWTELPAALGVRDLAPLADGSLLAATDFGVARSLDQGATWNPPLPLAAETVTAPKDALTRIFVSAAAPGALLAAGAAGIWTSGDGGTRWEASNRGMVAQGIFSLTAAPVGVPALTTSIEGNGVFRSTDRGTTWTRVHAAVEGIQPSAHLTLDPRHPRTIYGTSFDGIADHLLRSSDGGRTWDTLPFPYSCSGGSICDVTMFMVAVDANHPETVFVAGFYFFHFGGSGNFLVRSDDGFATSQSQAPLPLNSLIADPGRPGAFYGLTCGHFFQTVDGGASWRKAGRGLPLSVCKSAMVLDPHDPRRIWVGTAGKGVFLSSDGGATFQAMNNGLETGGIATLLTDPAHPDRLYAGTGRQGVYRWNAERRRWTPLNQGLPLTGYTGLLVLDPQHPSTLYAVHPAQGIFRLDLEDTKP